MAARNPEGLNVARVNDNQSFKVQTRVNDAFPSIQIRVELQCFLVIIDASKNDFDEEYLLAYWRTYDPDNAAHFFSAGFKRRRYPVGEAYISSRHH
jgi:hypothetical protein